jgi:hypothetical protein
LMVATQLPPTTTAHAPIRTRYGERRWQLCECRRGPPRFSPRELRLLTPGNVCAKQHTKTHDLRCSQLAPEDKYLLWFEQTKSPSRTPQFSFSKSSQSFELRTSEQLEKCGTVRRSRKVSVFGNFARLFPITRFAESSAIGIWRRITSSCRPITHNNPILPDQCSVSDSACYRQLRAEQDHWPALLILYSISWSHEVKLRSMIMRRTVDNRLLEANSFPFRWHGVYGRKYSHYETSEERGAIKT